MDLEVQINIDMLDVKDIMSIFKISKNQAYNLLHLQGFPKIIIGRKILVPRDKLKKWIDSNIGKTLKL